MGNFLKLTGAVTAGTLLAGGVIKLGSVIANAFSKSDDSSADDQPKKKAGRPKSKSSAKSAGNDSK